MESWWAAMICPSYVLTSWENWSRYIADFAVNHPPVSIAIKGANVRPSEKNSTSLTGPDVSAPDAT